MAVQLMTLYSVSRDEGSRSKYTIEIPIISRVKKLITIDKVAALNPTMMVVMAEKAKSQRWPAPCFPMVINIITLIRYKINKSA